MLRYHLLWLVSLGLSYPVYQWIRMSKVISVISFRFVTSDDAVLGFHDGLDLIGESWSHFVHSAHLRSSSATYSSLVGKPSSS